MSCFNTSWEVVFVMRVPKKNKVYVKKGTSVELKKKLMSFLKGTKICNQNCVRGNMKILFVANVKAFEFSIKNLQ